MENFYECLIESSHADDKLSIPKRGKCKILTLDDYVEIVVKIKEDNLMYGFLPEKEKLIQRKVNYSQIFQFLA
jgi:hypothetical protein